MSDCNLDRAAGTLKSSAVRSEEEVKMTRLKARMMVIVAAALVGAVSVPLAVAEKGADDPVGHVRHAKHKKNTVATAFACGILLLVLPGCRIPKLALPKPAAPWPRPLRRRHGSRPRWRRCAH